MLKIFGKNPSGKELEKVTKSANYRNGAFQNLSETRVMAEDSSFFKAFAKFINKPKDNAPPGRIPSVKTDLKETLPEKTFVTWFGHSSYLIQANGKNILVDPVFSGNASPFTFAVKSFEGSDIYSADDMPLIDVLILTHDHYDHLDYKTVVQLKDKTRMVCTSLGVASHLIYWGFEESRIIEFDWWDKYEILPGIELIATPARHFSGRSFTRGKTLWSSFVLKTPRYTLFIGGDGGYDSHFKLIGEKYGPFDLAILETGQYNTTWPQIHMMPEETVQAAIDLNAKVILPVHWGKFSLALHGWNEPVKRLLKTANELKKAVTTPMIGEPVILDEKFPDKPWWDIPFVKSTNK